MTTGIDTTDPSVLGIKKQQSTGNLFSEIQSEVGVTEAYNDGKLHVIPSIAHPSLKQQPYDSKVELSNAKTLRPYVSIRKNYCELVPIFYKRNPRKTRNSLA
jgi:hypothetical protein